MKQLYVITESGGAYDGAWERAEFVTDNEAKGNAYVDRMNSFTKEVAKSRSELVNGLNKWQKNNPRPDVGDDIFNQEDARVYREWANRLKAAHLERTATYSEEIQDGLKNDADDMYWSIEPITWLK